jgi:hypothetical protein
MLLEKTQQTGKRLSSPKYSFEGVKCANPPVYSVSLLLKVEKILEK